VPHDDADCIGKTQHLQLAWVLYGWLAGPLRSSTVSAIAIQQLFALRLSRNGYIDGMM